MANRLPQHRPHRPNLPQAQARPTTAQRGYDSVWRALRLMVLRREPLCRRCGHEASQVDHIRPIRQGGARLDPENLQALCHSCHSRKTRTEDM